MDAKTGSRFSIQRIDHVWIRAAQSALLAGLAILALLFVARRISGALERPLDARSLLALAAIVSASAFAARWGPSIQTVVLNRYWLDWSILVLPSVSLGGIGMAVMVSETPLSGLAGYWVIVASEEFWFWRRSLAWRRTMRPVEPAKRRQSRTQTKAAVDFPDQPQSKPANDATVWQHTTRTTTADGAEVLEAWLRCGFQPGQRLSSAHLAFCPPFARQVSIVHRQLAGPDSRVKVSQLLLHGARLDIKLATACDHPVEIVLECTVTEELAPR